MNLPPLLIPWRKPWSPISDDHGRGAKAELQRELCPKHVLHGRIANAIGCRQDCDDVLFYLEGAAPNFAVVHLTYRHETDPIWPTTQLFGSISDWIEQCMNPEVDDWE